MPRDKDRIGPLAEAHHRPVVVGVDVLLRAVHPLDHLDNRDVGFALEARRPPDAEVVVQHALDGLGVEAEHLGRPPGSLAEHAGGPANRLQIDRADVAEVLGEDQVRAQLGEKLGVQRVEGLARLHRCPDLPVDGAGRIGVGGVVACSLDRSLGRESGQVVEPGGEIALVAPPDEQLAPAHAGEDLGRAGQQAHDAHDGSKARDRSKRCARERAAGVRCIRTRARRVGLGPGRSAPTEAPAGAASDAPAGARRCARGHLSTDRQRQQQPHYN